MNAAVPAETVGRHETPWTRSLSLGRRPWTLGAAAALLLAAAAIGFLAGHASAPVRTAPMPSPVTSAPARPLVVRVPRATAAALPALRALPTAPKQTAAGSRPASSRTPAPSPPGYTIVGG